MNSVELYERVWCAIDDATGGVVPRDVFSPAKATANVLAALGLDDWDEMLSDNPSGHDVYVRIGARVWKAGEK